VLAVGSPAMNAVARYCGVPSPGADHDLGFIERVEDLSVEQFVTQFAVERFDIAVLPRTAGFNVSSLGSDCRSILEVPSPRTRGHYRNGCALEFRAAPSVCGG